MPFGVYLSHVDLPYEHVSDVTIFQVMCILILPGDNWYPAINASKAVEEL